MSNEGEKPKGLSPEELYSEPAAPAEHAEQPGQAEHAEQPKQAERAERTEQTGKAKRPEQPKLLADEAAALRRLADHIANTKRRAPILVLFGFSYAGKTALAIRLQNIYTEGGGRYATDGQHRQFTVTPPIDRVGSSVRTDAISCHDFIGTNANENFILVDLPGEYFFNVVESGFNSLDSDNILKLMTAADGYIILLEADKTIYRREMAAISAMTELDKTQFQKFVSQIISFTNLDWQMERKMRELKGAEAAIEWVKQASATALRDPDETLRKSSKPVLLGLSIADRLLDNIQSYEEQWERQNAHLNPGQALEGDAINRARGVANTFDRDPLYFLLKRYDLLYNHIAGAFRTFRIDFLTSFSKLPERYRLETYRDEITADVCSDHRAYGVERNFEWLRIAATRRRRAKMNWLSTRVGRYFQWLPSLRDTNWALKVRRKWDEDYRRV